MENKAYLKIIKIDSVGSTNVYSCKLAKDGAREITIVRANSQTKGRGRMGRSWISPKNKGIYSSFIFRPSNSLDDMYYLPVIFALAVARALQHILPLKIKLPNDIVAADRKIAGILVEAKVAKEKADFVVVGIGINVNAEKEELVQKASSLYLETGIKYNIDDLFRKLIMEVIFIYNEFKRGNIKALLKEVFLYQEIKSLKKLQVRVLRNKAAQEWVHLL
ncbi:MAG: biotin--[acetyl-CoA-carboxylase] ligase [Candidatus Omnitrophota bacterium]|nr:biotin--[acetyl-CoA-carboxylase] ligase [Candidatus Omnitrophota bacterium]